MALQHISSQLHVPQAGRLVEPAELSGLQQVTFDTIYAPYIVVAFQRQTPLSRVTLSILNGMRSSKSTS